MEKKLCSLKQAVARHVQRGDSVVMGTALESLIPFAAGYEIVRQRIRDLTVVGPISDILFDLMIGAGCVSRVVAAWVGNVMMGTGYNFRRAMEETIPGPLEVVDHSNFTLQTALKAAAQGLPFLPTRTALGSSIEAGNPHLRPFSCPFTGERLLAVEAFHPDVAILHVQRADAQGNAHAWGNLGVTQEAALAARRVIVTAEEIVPPEVISSDPNRTIIPGFLVTAVVEARWGSHPSPTQGYANRDHEFYRRYHAETRTLEGFARWIGRYVFSPKSHPEYLGIIDEEGRMAGLGVTRSSRSAPAEFGY
ncbi:MAG: CoA transferase subunit A [Deltaproteobacteria bacterium]|nr:CoA transferase subunit A [Deltaproteobacteria bacterium]